MFFIKHVTISIGKRGERNMSSIRINFSNGESLILKEGDIISYFIEKKDNLEDDRYGLTSKDLEINWNMGGIPSFMTTIFDTKFFYVNENYDVIYGTNSIVKVEIC